MPLYTGSLRIEVFYFYVKRKEQFEQCLPSSCNIIYMKQAPFLLFGKLSYSFLCLDQLPTFYLLSFQCCKITPHVLLMHHFYQHHFWDIFLLIIMTTSFIYIGKLTFTSSSSCISRVSSNGDHVSISIIGTFSCNFIYVLYKFPFQCKCFLFLFLYFVG